MFVGNFFKKMNKMYNVLTIKDSFLIIDQIMRASEYIPEPIFCLEINEDSLLEINSAEAIEEVEKNNLSERMMTQRILEQLRVLF